MKEYFYKLATVAVTLIFTLPFAASARLEVPLTQEEIEAILEKNNVTDLSSSTLPKELRREDEATINSNEAIDTDEAAAELSLRQEAEQAVEGLRADWRAKLYQARDVWTGQQLGRIKQGLEDIVTSAGSSPGDLGGWFREQAGKEYESINLAAKGFDEVRQRNKILLFLIGPDSAAVTKTREAVLVAYDELDKIKERKKDLKAEVDRNKLDQQTAKVKAELDSFSSEFNRLANKFSLWGWLKGLFTTKPLKGNS